MKGEIVYLYAYDLAYEANLTGIEALMRGTAERFQLGRLKDAPRNFSVYQPLSIQMEESDRDGQRGPLKLITSVKIFSLGAVSVKVRVPVTCENVMDLLAFRDLRFADGTMLDAHVQGVAQRVFDTVKPQLDTPVAKLAQPEVYTFFCVHTPPVAGPDRSVEGWLRENERSIAALLAGETDPARLSEQEVRETMQHRYSYYQDDVVIVDWDTAFVADTPEGYQDTLYVLEVANLQLEGLRVYDTQLDAVLDKAYDDVEAMTRLRAFGSRQRVLGELREIKMDLTKVAEEISNLTKFFGDWHLARIYMGCAARFHLAKWDNIVDRKLRTLNGLYTMLQQDSTNRVMMILEIAIVALFVIDLIVIVALGVK